MLLLLIIVIVAVADLVGVFIIASASVDGVSQPYSSIAYFIGGGHYEEGLGERVGATNSSEGVEISGGSYEESLYQLTSTIFSSAEFYPHILLQGEQIAFLPTQLGEPAPISYNGPALGGNFSHECVPAVLSGTILFSPLEDFIILVDGTIAAQLSQGLRSEQVFCNISTFNLIISTEDELQLVASCLFFNPVYHWDGLWHFVVLKFSETFSNASYTATVSEQSNGSFPRVRKEPGLNWALYVCEIALPYLVGDVIASSISPVETLLYSSSDSLYPNMPIHETTMTFSPWSKNTELERLNFSHNRPDDASSRVIQAFADPGVLFCRWCIGGVPLADTLVSSLVGDSGPEDLSNALSVALLYSMASMYRRQAPHFVAGYPCQYSLKISATMVTRPAFLYTACAYTLCIAIVALVLRLVVLRKLGVQRTGFVLSTCAAVQDSPLQAVISRGDMRSRDELLVEIDEIEGPIKLGAVASGHQAQPDVVTMPYTGEKSSDQTKVTHGKSLA